MRTNVYNKNHTSVVPIEEGTTKNKEKMKSERKKDWLDILSCRFLPCIHQSKDLQPQRQ
uniref:Uncharacterized protein n=1 Tax=Nelumbo nucifera TaxID=4432 RepID=A0A822ZKE8_NELNU|nr:TPA_asm: hypothetical protein HUJ06_003220 [Nelumbo nucifera]